MKVAKLYEYAILPTRKHSTDAGLDLYAYLQKHHIDSDGDYILTYTIIDPHGIGVINTGIVVDIPYGCFGWITNKSRNNYLIGGGIVDYGYQGELLVKIINTSNTPLTINHGDAIAQLLILPCLTPRVEEISKNIIFEQESERSSTGGIVTQMGTIDVIFDDKITDEQVEHTKKFLSSLPCKVEITEAEYDALADSWVPDEDDYDYARDDMNFDADRERRFG